MRPDLRSFRVKDHYLIGANVDMHVVVLQPDARSVAYDVDFEADCMHRFFLSQDGGLLAAAFAFEAFCCVEVVDLSRNPIITPESREAATVLRIDRVDALDVGIAPTGETLLYVHATKPGGYAVHLPSGHRQRLPDTLAPMNGAWLTDAVLLPLGRGRGGIRVSYWPLAVSPVELPSKVRIWRLTERPSGQSIGMLTKGYVASLRADILEPLWKRAIAEADWISYSGDGRFIAVQQRAPAGGPVERIVVLDASSGEIARTIEQPEQALFPLDGPRFLCYSGRFLNAETGEFEEGVSAPGFWDKILKRRP